MQLISPFLLGLCKPLAHWKQSPHVRDPKDPAQHCSPVAPTLTSSMLPSQTQPTAAPLHCPASGTDNSPLQTSQCITTWTGRGRKLWELQQQAGSPSFDPPPHSPVSLVPPRCNQPHMHSSSGLTVCRQMVHNRSTATCCRAVHG